jgi:hypothetical protein
MHATDCPQPAELAEFAIGDLPRAALTRIAGHLEDCAACTAVLSRFDGLTDSILSRLRQVAVNEDVAASDVPPQLLEVALTASSS